MQDLALKVLIMLMLTVVRVLAKITLWRKTHFVMAQLDLHYCEESFVQNMGLNELLYVTLHHIALAFGSVFECSANDNQNCQLHLVKNCFLAMFMYKSCFYLCCSRRYIRDIHTFRVHCSCDSEHSSVSHSILD